MVIRGLLDRKIENIGGASTTLQQGHKNEDTTKIIISTRKDIDREDKETRREPVVIETEASRIRARTQHKEGPSLERGLVHRQPQTILCSPRIATTSHLLRQKRHTPKVLGFAYRSS